jgi:very-short-patch-repair endonuclease
MPKRYDDSRIGRARQLRRHQTPAERLLWGQLRCRRLAGLKFRRQYPCGPYVLDFFCESAGLGLELDGEVHFHPARFEDDERRTRFLARRGIRVLRFENDRVMTELQSVLEQILLEATGHPCP